MIVLFQDGSFKIWWNNQRISCQQSRQKSSKQLFYQLINSVSDASHEEKYINGEYFTSETSVEYS